MGFPHFIFFFFRKHYLATEKKNFKKFNTALSVYIGNWILSVFGKNRIKKKTTEKTVNKSNQANSF